MQFEITDEAACTVAKELYTCLGEGLPLESAVSEARLTLLAQRNFVEWATPVLYLRTDGQIFSLQPSASHPPLRVRKPRTTSPAGRAPAKAKPDVDDTSVTARASHATASRDMTPLLPLPNAPEIGRNQENAQAQSENLPGEEVVPPENDGLVDRLLLTALSVAAVALSATMFITSARWAFAWFLTSGCVLLLLGIVYVARRWLQSQ